MKKVLVFCLLVVACAGPRERTLSWNHEWTQVTPWRYYEISFDQGKTWQGIHDPITTGNGQWTAKISLANGDYTIAIRACNAEARIRCTETAAPAQIHLR